ncbi:MAG: hypothetical protein JW779_02550 [Candidatus Thorarchaeota archaeon]|nr:hypothetical protein [Candidatus Thorarchaeota archaeon]
MNDTLTPERKKRRKSIKGASRIEYAGPLTKEIIEDFVIAAPNVQILHIELLDDTSFNLSDLRELKDLLVLKVSEGYDLKQVSLEGIQEFNLLTGLEININSADTIEEIDLAPLKNHPELTVLTIAGQVRTLKAIDTLNTIPKLNSIGLYSLDISELDLSSLGGCSKLESVYLGDLGSEKPTKPYRIILPKEAPIKILEISECYSDDLVVEVDYSFLKGKVALDSFSVVNCNLTSFDLGNLASLKRIGHLDLSQNKITHLDITPILDIPMFTEEALGESPFATDQDVIIQISKNKEQEIDEILKRPDKIVEDHDGSFAINYEFGHQWLRKLLESYTIEWIE